MDMTAKQQYKVVTHVLRLYRRADKLEALTDRSVSQVAEAALYRARALDVSRLHFMWLAA